jgi:isopenicillin-N N-acyltransferase like protein
MTRTFTSAPAEPRERGLEFGEANRDEIHRTVAAYRELIDVEAGTLEPIRALAPELADEIEGIAAAADLPVRELAAVNSRTELLPAGPRGECSTVVALPGDGRPPVSVQTWDWFGALAENWLVWTIEHPDGRVVHTVTEYGIVGKIGVNGAGLGLHLNILHHERDGGPVGAPVHILARRVLDRATDVTSALELLTPAPVSASSSFTVVDSRSAVSCELSPAGPGAVLPTPGGVLLHTNHFLAERGRPGCTELVTGPDSFVRYDALRRAVGERALDLSEADVLAALSSHAGGVCCHPPAGADPAYEYATLATVAIDVAACELRVHAGGPCSLPDHALSHTSSAS